MYEVLGYRYVDMTDGDKEIKGYSVFFAVDEGVDDLKGRSTCKVFFSEAKYPEFIPIIGQHMDVFFNQKGRLQGFHVVS